MAEQNDFHEDVDETEPLLGPSNGNKTKNLSEESQGETEHETQEKRPSITQPLNGEGGMDQIDHDDTRVKTSNTNINADSPDIEINENQGCLLCPNFFESCRTGRNRCSDFFESCKTGFLRRLEFFERFKTGNNFIVALGVVVLAVVFAIMLVNWAKLIFNQTDSSMMVFIVLIIFNLIGVFSIFFLACSRLDRTSNVQRNEKKLTFLDIKLYSMYTFGLCFFFHCGLYAWKHHGSDCPHHKLALAYNIIAMIYTFVLFLYFKFYHDRRTDNSKMQNLFSVGILLANVCIWLDAIFSESNDLFQYSDAIAETNDTKFVMFNITNSSSICYYPERAMKAIEKTEPFFSPAIIEFSLMAIDLLFLKSESPSEQPDEVEVGGCCIFFRKCFQALFSLTSFALFALTFTFVIIQDKIEDLSNFPDDFTTYVAFQISIKIIMLMLILICMSVVWTNMKYHFNVWCMVLLISCFGNVVNHMIYCFGLTVNKGHIKIPTYDLTMSWVDNIISIILAFCQTNYLLGTHSHIEYNDSCCCTETCSDFYKTCVNYFCFLIGILNLGLWIGDSIGEGRIPVLSYPMYQAYDPQIWNVIIKLVLPLTIFFRFHTGLSFLEMYWERDKVIRIEQ